MGELYNQRLKNFEDAVNFREPERVPLQVELMTYPFAYGGTTYKAVMTNPEGAVNAYRKFLDDVPFDCAMAVSPTFPVNALQSLGIKHYLLAKDDCMIENDQTAMQYMDTSDYGELTANPADYRLKFVQERTPGLCVENEEDAYQNLLTALREYRSFYAVNQAIQDEIFGKREVINLAGLNGPYFESAFTLIFNTYRGISTALTDLRRRPNEVMAACDAIFEQNYGNLKINPDDYRNGLHVGFTSYHPECFVSPAWFDKIFFNKFAEMYGPAMEAGLKFYVKGEGHFLNTIERYRALPKGAMILQIDQDDPFEVYKTVGDWCTLVMGLRVDMLNGSKDKLVDYIKRCFDTFAPGGGFIFGMDKPLMSAKDAKPENIVAAYETAYELAGKH